MLALQNSTQTTPDATLTGSSLGTDIFVLADVQIRGAQSWVPSIPLSLGVFAVRNSAMVQGLGFMAEFRQNAVGHRHQSAQHAAAKHKQAKSKHKYVQ